MSGEPECYIVYDRAREGVDEAKGFRVATFLDRDQAEEFLREKPDSYYLIVRTATRGDRALAR